MKNVAFYTALLISAHLSGQPQLQDDTIAIREVVISRRIISPAGFRIIRLDSQSISDFGQKSLADLLSEASSIYVKSYGPAGIASPSFRGTGPGHAKIAWNDINLNNPMLGQFDMSLVPAGFADDVEIYYGGGSMDVDNGGIGGVINIETKPDWKSENLLFFSSGLGSFGRYSGLIKVRSGNEYFQSVTKAFLSSAENDFAYLNTISNKEPVRERRQNSQVGQKGIIQELYLKRPGGLISTRFWYQSTFRNLPAPLSMLSVNQSEEQDDRSLRALLSYETLNTATDLNFSAAYISDRLDYINRFASINSRNKSGSMILKASAEPFINGMIRLKLFGENELNVINSNNYGEKRTRNLACAGVSAETVLSRRVTAKMLLRGNLMDRKFLAPDFSLGTEIRIVPEREHFVKANFSKNSKIPTLNDMYWIPGGNPDLKNENGFSAEIGWNMGKLLFPSLKIEAGLTAFGNYINNMIQWYPGNNSFWIAGNVGRIRTAGLESELNLFYSLHNFTVSGMAAYTFTRASALNGSARDGDQTEKQMVYMPSNQLNSLLRINWKNFTSAIRLNYTGLRYTDADNSQHLPGHMVTNINLGFKLNSKITVYDINMAVDNVFNSTYQEIAWYPMPGRAYSLSLIFQLKK